jgi:hypothetical protein
MAAAAALPRSWMALDLSLQRKKARRLGWPLEVQPGHVECLVPELASPGRSLRFYPSQPTTRCVGGLVMGLRARALLAVGPW